MGGSSNYFQYTPLETAETIRILELQPGIGHELIQGRLRHVKFNLAPPYEAISYRWGDQTKKEEVSCGGHAIGVTTNLANALRRVRSPHGTRILWADALCIDQQDLNERSH